MRPEYPWGQGPMAPPGVTDGTPPRGSSQEAKGSGPGDPGPEEMVVMMFGYGSGGWPVWEVALMWAGEQQMLRRAGILVAGCGSIGGAVVEPLVRMGAERLVLGEPHGGGPPHPGQHAHSVPVARGHPLAPAHPALRAPPSPAPCTN